MANICLERDFLMYLCQQQMNHMITIQYSVACSVIKKKGCKIVANVCHFLTASSKLQFIVLSLYIEKFFPFQKKNPKKNLNISQSMNYSKSTMWIQNRNLYTYNFYYHADLNICIKRTLLTHIWQKLFFILSRQ